MVARNKMSFGDISDDTCSGKIDIAEQQRNSPKTPRNHMGVLSSAVNIQNHELNNFAFYECIKEGCHQVFEFLWQLDAHIEQAHHETVEQYPNKKCKQETKKHKCTEPGCEAAFQRPFKLKNHILTHHGGQRPFRCHYEGCKNTYTNGAHLKRHVIIVHIGEDISRVCETEGCGMICANNYSLKRHIARAHTNLPYECHLCREKFSCRNLLHTCKTEVHNEEGPYKCTKCTRTFIHFYLYRKHKNRHKTYKCDCEMSFGRWAEYLKHKREDCTIPKPEYKCVICSKTFSVKHNLTEHCLNVHLHESQKCDEFKCSYPDCNRSYKYEKNLKYHIKTFHEKVFKYFKCTQEDCEVILKSKKNLKQHLQNGHSNRPIKAKLRKPRKDKGISKKSTAPELRGMKVAYYEQKKNIAGQTVDKNLNQVDANIPENVSKLASHELKILYRSEKKNSRELLNSTLASETSVKIDSDHRGSDNINICLDSIIEDNRNSIQCNISTKEVSCLLDESYSKEPALEKVNLSISGNVQPCATGNFEMCEDEDSEVT